MKQEMLHPTSLACVKKKVAVKANANYKYISVIYKSVFSTVHLCECTKLQASKGFIIRSTLLLHHSLRKT